MNLAAWIEGAIPPLMLRLRREMVRHWTARCAAAVDGQPGPSAAWLEAAGALMDADRREARLARERLATLEGAWGEADLPARRRLGRAFLDAAGSPASRRGRRAAARRADLGLLREHGLRCEARARRGRLIGAAVLGRGAAAWIADPDAALEVLAGPISASIAALAAEVGRPAAWTLHLEVLQGLAEVERALIERGAAALWPAELGATLVALGGRSAVHPAVRAAALSLAATSPGRAGVAYAIQALQPKVGDRLAFLIRRAVLTTVVARRPVEDAVTVLTAWAWADDPSEHVRIGVAEACGHLRALDLLSVLDRLAGLGDPEEPSAKVRAVAARALVALLVDGAPVAERIAARLRQERATLPLLCLAEAIRAAAPALASGAAALLPALSARLTDASLPGEAHEALAAAAERLAREGLDEVKSVEAMLVDAIRGLSPGGVARVRVSAAVPDDVIGRILAAESRRDLGLSARRRGERLTIWRGEIRRRRLWRVLHELRRPAPTKRVGQLHTVGRAPRGYLRAPPGLMDEVTPTEVPGERVHVGREGGWGRALPMVDDLIALPVLRRRAVRIYSSFGVTVLRAPASLLGRLMARARLTWRYATYAELRLGAYRAAEPRRRRAFLDAVAGMGFEVDFSPHLEGGTPPSLSHALVQRAPGGGVAGGALVLDPEHLGDLLGELRDFVLSWAAGDQRMLTLFLGGLASAFLLSAWLRTRAARRARARLPMTIGGWGTRGKSGTERLKAALFHGLDYDVFVKTTGCEAVFMHSVPGQRQEEILLYRPYDRASIWEHEAMVRLAAGLGSEVFLWECMALRSRYVDVLQHDWMRDDLATLTNAYPDHEDVQGPAGYDVARTLSGFIPARAQLVTAEVNFLPVVEAAARRRGTSVRALDAQAGDLLADDLLALFPYTEHPRNIALVAALGESLGVPPDLAMLTMAFHVVPDLGVLSVCPPARIRGREIIFVNGMSANERAGFLSNWSRVGLDDVPVEAPGRAVMTVVNNRADRLARSQVFARLLVEEVAADRHVLIGTNLDGLLGFIEEALDRHLADRGVVLLGDDVERACLRLRREFGRVRLPAPGADAFVARLGVWARGIGRSVPPDLEAAIRPVVTRWLATDGPVDDPRGLRARIDEDGALSAALAAFAQAAPHLWPGAPEVIAPPDVDAIRAAACRLLAGLIIAARVERAVRAACEVDEPARGDAAYRAALRALFLDSLVVVDDPEATGDQIIDVCAGALPPGVEAHVMGIQNIKGTGLDFVYRWQAFLAAQDAIGALSASAEARRIEALGQLAEMSSPGVVAAGVAVAALATHRPQSEVERLAWERARAQMQAAHDASLRGLGRRRRGGRLRGVWNWTWGLVDWIDAVRRAREARRTLAALRDGRASHRATAEVMLALNERQKRSAGK